MKYAPLITVLPVDPIDVSCNGVFNGKEMVAGLHICTQETRMHHTYTHAEARTHTRTERM